MNSHPSCIVEIDGISTIFLTGKVGYHWPVEMAITTFCSEVSFEILSENKARDIRKIKPI